MSPGIYPVPGVAIFNDDTAVPTFTTCALEVPLNWTDCPISYCPLPGLTTVKYFELSAAIKPAIFPAAVPSISKVNPAPVPVNAVVPYVCRTPTVNPPLSVPALIDVINPWLDEFPDIIRSTVIPVPPPLVVVSKLL